MKLTVKERILLSQLYPKQGDMVSQTLVRDMDKKVRLEQKELTAIGLKVNPNGRGFTWDATKAKDRDIEFTDAELGLLKAEVAKLDTAKQINQDILDICIRIKKA